MVFDVYEFEGIIRQISVLGHHDGHGLAHVANAVGSQDRMERGVDFVGVGACAGWQFGADASDVLGGGNKNDAG